MPRCWAYDLTPDDAAFILLSEEYSYYNEPMWNGDWYHGITNGAQWYRTFGSIQDWSYHETDCMHVIVEFSDNYAPPEYQLDQYWDDNRESFMHWIKAARYGVNGIVTDSQTGLPVSATVMALGIDKAVHTDPEVGDYYKLLHGGTFDIVFSAPGYVTQTVTDVSTTWGIPTVLNVQLMPAATGTVEGHVMAAGMPADGSVEITTYPMGDPVAILETEAANAGHYSIELFFGDYLFTVTSDGCLPEERIVVVDLPYQQQDFLLMAVVEMVLFEDDLEGGAGNWDGDWALTTSSSHSPAHSMTDSPSGEYGDGWTRPCAMNCSVNLGLVMLPELTFYARWFIEENYDCVQLQISTNGGMNWTAIATEYTTLGSGQGVQPEGEPVYEGFQSSWVADRIDLAPWADEDDVRFRFLLRTDGSVTEDGFYFDDFRIGGVVVTTEVETEAPGATALLGSFPNPFNPMTTLRFQLAESSAAKLTVYDVLGRRVRHLHDGVLEAGVYEFEWNGRDDADRSVPGGVYFARLRAGDLSYSSKLVLLK